MTLPLWKAVESVANAIDELRKQTCDLAEKVAKDVVQLEQKVEALTVEVEQLKQEPKQEQRFVEFTRAFPPTQLTIKGDGKTLDALIEKEGISLFDVDRILRDQVPVEGVVHGDTGFQVQWKEGSGATEPDPDTDPVYHWEVRDMEDQFQAGGQASTFHEAMSSARSYAYQYAPYKVRVWTEKTIHEATLDD